MVLLGFVHVEGTASYSIRGLLVSMQLSVCLLMQGAQTGRFLSVP